jgi:hypothetical protein
MILLQLIASILVHFAAANMTQWKPSDSDWNKAANEIRHLSPSSFSELPREIIGELNRRQCTIPQVDGSPRSHNAVKGSFTGQGQTDWAVLCSHRGESSILVFKGLSIKPVFELAKNLDKSWLQVMGERKIGYSRMISAANGEAIQRYHTQYGGPKPPAIDHEGIEDSFVEKGSVIFYYHKGSWLRLTGAD